MALKEKLGSAEYERRFKAAKERNSRTYGRSVKSNRLVSAAEGGMAKPFVPSEAQTSKGYDKTPGMDGCVPINKCRDKDGNLQRFKIKLLMRQLAVLRKETGREETPEERAELQKEISLKKFGITKTRTAIVNDELQRYLDANRDHKKDEFDKSNIRMRFTNCRDYAYDLV